MVKKALITGITGQDGSYLAEFLLAKGYEVHGIRRSVSSSNIERIEHILDSSESEPDIKNVKLHYGNSSDSSRLVQLMTEIEPDEVYNLAAQSHVGVSFELPEYTADVNGLGTVRLLESIRLLGLEQKTRFYQASTSELFGRVKEVPQTETTPFHPCSPYAIAKMYAYWITVNYRESYGLYACNGILFNHESPRRGDTFVTRKITQGIANIACGLQDCLFLGNLDALRDWGHAKDFVQMQWLMLQQEKAEDFVIATGNQLSVREFVILAAKQVGIELAFEGEGNNEVARVKRNAGVEAPSVMEGDVIVRIDPSYHRPNEVDSLLGDASKAKARLGWQPKISVEELCAEMVAADLNIARRNCLLQKHGYATSGTKQ